MSDNMLLSDQRLILKFRKELSAGGIIDVDSYDEKIIVAQTQTGELEISGSGLKILSFSKDSGELCVEGEMINSLVYTGEKRETGFFRRLFK